MTKSKIGILGCGYMAQVAHIPALKSLDTVEITAVCDARPTLAVEVAKTWDISGAYESREEFLKEDFDAVFILTPVQFHAADIRAALQAGKHIFCEKPAAMAAESVRALAELQAKSNRTVSIGYMKRHDNNLHFYKKLQQDGAWGKLTFIRAHSFVGKHWNAAVNDLCKCVSTEQLPSFDAAVLDSGPGWIRNTRDAVFYSFENPYYGLLDTGCHTVNLIRYLAEKTPLVTAVRNQAGVRLIDFDFDGFSGSMEFSLNFRMYRWDEVTELYFENASVRILTPPPLDRQATSLIEIYSENGDSKQQLTLQDNHQWAFRAQAETFIGRLQSGEVYSDLDDAEKDIEIIEQIYRKEMNQ